MILNGKIISVVAFKIKHVRNHEQIIQRKKQYVELVCYTVLSIDNGHVAQILEQTNEYVLSMR